MAEWKQLLLPYEQPVLKRAIWQLANTLVPYAIIWLLLYWSLHVSYWLTAPLAVLAGGFLVRLFIIFHDCGHGSFFKSQRANTVVGFITGVLTFTPYHVWRWEHALHHATASDLDRRGTGDVWTLTVQEYLEASRWKKFSYRLARNPAVLFVLAPLFLFLVRQRFCRSRTGTRERWSLYATNAVLAGWAGWLMWIFGWKAYFIIQLTVLIVAGSAGVWLFYVQHQFEGVYWERNKQWSFETAALEGSSFYKLPKVLQWFTGNIGFHHVHHLSARVPNYHLERCHKAHPLFHSVKAVTLWSSLKCLRFRLWDEQDRKLVSFAVLKRYPSA